MEFDGPIFDTIQPSSWINLHPQKFPTFAAYKLDGPRKKMPGQQAHGRTESCSEGMRIRTIGNWYVHQLKTNPVYRGIGSHGPFVNKKGRLSPARIEGRSTSMQAWICQQTRVWMLVQPNFEFSTKHVHGHVGNCLVGHPTCWVVPNLVHTLELHLECTHFIPIYIYIYHLYMFLHRVSVSPPPGMQLPSVHREFRCVRLTSRTNSVQWPGKSITPTGDKLSWTDRKTQEHHGHVE